MRRAILPCAIVLALISGIMLNETRIVALAPISLPPRAEQTSATVKVVTQFYTRVNEAIASGDVTSVSHLLARDLVDHSIRPGLRPGQTSLIDLVQTLHVIDANLRVVPAEMIGQGKLVSARVDVSLPKEPSLHGQTVTVSRLWSAFDVFRVEGNQIVEHWDDASGMALFARVLDISVPHVGPVRRAVTLERWTYAPAAAESWGAGLGPLLLYVDVGALTVEVDSAEGRSARHLSQGESIVVPERGHIAVQNEEQTESVALVVQLIAPASPGADDSFPSAGMPGIVHTTLASGGAAKLPTGQAMLSISRLVLAPDADLAPHAVDIVELIAVERGTLALSTDGGGAMITMSATGATQYVSDGEVIPAGGGAMVAQGTVAGYPVGSQAPLELLIVSIGPPRDPDLD